MLCVLSRIDHKYQRYLGCSVFCLELITNIKDIQDALFCLELITNIKDIQDSLFCLELITNIKDIQDALCSVQY